MRRNAMREKQFIVLLYCGETAPRAVRSAVASNKGLQMEIKNKWSGDEPGIRR
jgi:hypothetical protein